MATEVEEVTSTEAAPAPVKRASNDPRSRRRHRDSQSSPKAVVPKVVPSQIPTLAQYTMSSLIRHVYGEDCTILIEQFGLVTTFNRALQKFAEQYANMQTAVDAWYEQGDESAPAPQLIDDGDILVKIEASWNKHARVCCK